MPDQLHSTLEPDASCLEWVYDCIRPLYINIEQNSKFKEKPVQFTIYLGLYYKHVVSGSINIGVLRYR